MTRRPWSNLPSRIPPISAPPRGSEKNASVTASRISSSTRAEDSTVKGHSGTLQVTVVLPVLLSVICLAAVPFDCRRSGGVEHPAFGNHALLTLDRNSPGQNFADLTGKSFTAEGLGKKVHTRIQHAMVNHGVLGVAG